MSNTDPNQFLMGGGVKSASFPDQQYGTTVGGEIIREPELRQQTDFDDGKPKFYDNGDPMMHIVVHVQTTQRDPLNPEDDGVRAFYIKAQMLQAVRTAVRAAGGKGLAQGGHLTIRYERDEPNSRGRGKDKKIYSAQYRVPSPAFAANNALMGGEPAAAPAQPAAPAYAPVAGSAQISQEELSVLEHHRQLRAAAEAERQRQASFQDGPPPF
jgi:hypothetical protein